MSERVRNEERLAIVYNLQSYMTESILACSTPACQEAVILDKEVAVIRGQNGILRIAGGDKIRQRYDGNVVWPATGDLVIRVL